MSHEELLGRKARLAVRRFGAPGAFLALDPGDRRSDGEVILLPGAEIPDGSQEGDEVEVFVHLDSEDRPIATTRAPKLLRGEVTFLEVTDVASFGAFVDWGLPKELLVPHREQTRELQRGDWHPIGLFVDDTGRLAGTMRIREMLRARRTCRLDEWIEGEAWRDEPELGLFVILERSFLGLVPRTEPHGLSRGERARFRVTTLHPDGKLELSLRGFAHEELERDAQNILAVLARPGARRFGDRSSPAEIRGAFGLSKKAFKRAVGRLLKTGRATLDREGFLVMDRQHPQK
jgi:predicted RNA-binding protein (virulence factor B family)